MTVPSDSSFLLGGMTFLMQLNTSNGKLQEQVDLVIVVQTVLQAFQFIYPVGCKPYL